MTAAASRTAARYSSSASAWAAGQEVASWPWTVITYGRCDSRVSRRAAIPPGVMKWAWMSGAGWLPIAPRAAAATLRLTCAQPGSPGIAR